MNCKQQLKQVKKSKESSNSLKYHQTTLTSCETTKEHQRIATKHPQACTDNSIWN